MDHSLREKLLDSEPKSHFIQVAQYISVLWGAKSWNSQKQNLSNLITFPHSAMRWIQRIKMDRFRKEKVKRFRIKKTFCNLPTNDQSLDLHLLPKKLKSTWIQCPRKSGQPQKSCRNLVILALRMMLPEMCKDGKLNEFIKRTKMYGQIF